MRRLHPAWLALAALGTGIAYAGCGLQTGGLDLAPPGSGGAQASSTTTTTTTSGQGSSTGGADAGQDAHEPDAHLDAQEDAREDAPSDARDDADADADAMPDAHVDSPDDAPPTCPTGQTRCGSDCVDLATDTNHCGACDTACAVGYQCGAKFGADMSTQPSGWSFNGTAIWDSSGPSARLTPANMHNKTGTVIYENEIVTDSFDVSFQFRIGANGGGRFDGMGFMILTDGATAVGMGAGGLGMSGLNGYGVELDVYDNGACGDDNQNHVGVDQLTVCDVNLPTSLYATDDLSTTINVDLGDANWHTADVQLANGAISVSIDTHQVANNVALPNFTAGTRYYYGFAGAEGGGGGMNGSQTEVKDVTVTFPTPRCF